MDLYGGIGNGGDSLLLLYILAYYSSIVRSLLKLDLGLIRCAGAGAGAAIANQRLMNLEEIFISKLTLWADLIPYDLRV